MTAMVPTATRSCGVMDAKRVRRPRRVRMKPSKLDLGRRHRESQRNFPERVSSEGTSALATIGSMNPDGEGRDLELRDYLVVLRRRKVTILVTTAIVIIAA